ncbi:MAG: hypothetical protein K1X88_11775 [Nannocystaceae bacterium]|nr:hypothetical protein [Nannocystaceae bacterium]
MTRSHQHGRQRARPWVGAALLGATALPVRAHAADCITAVSLSPADGAGEAAVFEARYGHCEGAAAFRVVQLWIGDEVDPQAERLNLGYEAGVIAFEGAGSCAPGDPVTLVGEHGSLDCAATTVSDEGDERVVAWALGFDVASFAGSHGVFFDAKGGTGDPEPRLGWTQMGSFLVEASAADTSGAASGSSEGSSGSDGGESSGSSSGGSAALDDGGLPGGTPHALPAGSGCGCGAQPHVAAPAWLLLLGLCRRNRARTRPSRARG